MVIWSISVQYDFVRKAKKLMQPYAGKIERSFKFRFEDQIKNDHVIK